MSIPTYTLIKIVTAPLTPTQQTPTTSQQILALNTQQTADVHVTMC